MKTEHFCEVGDRVDFVVRRKGSEEELFTLEVREGSIKLRCETQMAILPLASNLVEIREVK